LFAVGSLRTFVTHAHWFISGLEMLLIGSIAAAAAYGAGYFLRQLI
jgi:vacuolar iron transporter family protein